jgi:hypothetical protein
MHQVPPGHQLEQLPPRYHPGHYQSAYSRPHPVEPASEPVDPHPSRPAGTVQEAYEYLDQRGD